MTFCLDEKIDIFGQIVVAKFNISSYNYNCPLCGRYDGGIYDIRQLKILARRHLKKIHGLGIKPKENDCSDGCNHYDPVTQPKEKKMFTDIVGMDLPNLRIFEIAALVRKDWKKVYFGAVPYLKAMSTMSTVQDNYYEDSGTSVVLYFLSNATSWRGDVARAVKKELNRRCK